MGIYTKIVDQVLMEVPKGWDKESVESFLKSTGIDVNAKGAFAKIRAEFEKRGVPEDQLDGLAASIIDKAKGTTMWRTGPKGKHKATEEYQIVVPYGDAPSILQTNTAKKRGYVVLDKFDNERMANHILKTVKMERGNRNAFIIEV